MSDIADYAVREIVLEGDRFVLYRGRDARSTDVLIKVARAQATPRARSAFSSDFLIARRCDIPAIPRPIRIETMQDGSTFQVRQYVPGRPLSLWIDAVMPPPSLGEALQIGLSIVKALEPLHARGFVHCDVSPQNLLYDFETRTIYFADCAWAQGHASSPPSGRTFDSPYLAPEQRLPGEEPVDARTDLFAVGVIVHQLLSGGLPPSDSASLFPPDERIPIVAAGVLARLLNHDRERRYLTAAAAKKESDRCARPVAGECLGRRSRIVAGRRIRRGALSRGAIRPPSGQERALRELRRRDPRQPHTRVAHRRRRGGEIDAARRSAQDRPDLGRLGPERRVDASQSRHPLPGVGIGLRTAGGLGQHAGQGRAHPSRSASSVPHWTRRAASSPRRSRCWKQSSGFIHARLPPAPSSARIG